jgi:hypothetical protein
MDDALKKSKDTTHSTKEITNLNQLEPLDTRDMDTTIVMAKEIGGILKEEYKMFGLKKTIQLNVQIFLPIVIFFILLLLYLKGKSN